MNPASEEELSEMRQTQERIVADFEALGDWQERYRTLIKRGKDLGPMDEAMKSEERIVKGCQNRAWLHGAMRDDGVVEYFADSEAMIVRGFIALLLDVYSGHSPGAIIATPPSFIEELGLAENLSMNRANGLASFVKQIKLYALALQGAAALRTRPVEG